MTALEPLDLSHLKALEEHRTRAIARLSESGMSANERKLREIWLTQTEKEIRVERERLGLGDEPEMTDDELLAALEGLV